MAKGERSAKCPVHRGVHLYGQSNLSVTRRMRGKRWATLYAAKSLNWAGATPLLTAFNRPKFLGVAPAHHAGSVTVFWPRTGRRPACGGQSQKEVTPHRMQESWSTANRLARASSHAWHAVAFTRDAVESCTGSAWAFAHGDNLGGLHAR